MSQEQLSTLISFAALVGAIAATTSALYVAWVSFQKRSFQKAANSAVSLILTTQQVANELKVTLDDIESQLEDIHRNTERLDDKVLLNRLVDNSMRINDEFKRHVGNIEHKLDDKDLLPIDRMQTEVRRLLEESKMRMVLFVERVNKFQNVVKSDETNRSQLSFER